MRKKPFTLVGAVDGLFLAEGKGFETACVPGLDLTFEGIPGDAHSGATRRSGGREPWYPRRTEIRNERQISVVSHMELAEIAKGLGIDRLAPEWIGANIAIAGIERLSSLPARTLLFFEGGATIKIDGDNAPCRKSGRAVAAHVEGRADIERTFSREARHRRGLVGWVEKPGRVALGESVEIRVPEQWIYE
ncbi:MOSC domain-containing protein [Aureimonas sp. ME7]|uniref:MOSC domain-containing protein n=1 Tax=Aureimonas sp. ME7 TaxID=2744252 RepID=UPI001FCEF0D1|nr:MOSC domain-containing protein [Aureimonas sp. ME7]